jgi:hypothetical protein
MHYLGACQAGPGFMQTGSAPGCRYSLSKVKAFLNKLNLTISLWTSSNIPIIIGSSIPGARDTKSKPNSKVISIRLIRFTRVLMHSILASVF